MKNDIILAGVGGQGILTIAAIIGKAALKMGLNVKQSEVHGMAQRGGAVLAHLRLSSEPIYSDLIADGTADVIIAVEPMEALRHIRGLSPEGAVVTNSVPVKNIPYPELEELLKAVRAYPRSLVIDANEIASNVATPRAMNIVMLGAVSRYIDIDANCFREVLIETFARKGQEIVESNLKAFDAGRNA